MPTRGAQDGHKTVICSGTMKDVINMTGSKLTVREQKYGNDFPKSIKHISFCFPVSIGNGGIKQI